MHTRPLLAGRARPEPKLFHEAKPLPRVQEVLEWGCFRARALWGPSWKQWLNKSMPREDSCENNPA